MNKSISIDGVPYIDSREASARFQCTNDYMTRFCRQGKLKAQLIGRTWYIEEASLNALVKEQQEAKERAARELAETRRKEYELAQAKKQVTREPIKQEVFQKKAPVFEPSFVQPKTPLLPSSVSPILLFAKKGVSVALILMIGFGGHAFVISPYPTLIQKEASRQADVFVAKNIHAASVLTRASVETMREGVSLVEEVSGVFEYVAVASGVGIASATVSASNAVATFGGVVAASSQEALQLTASAVNALGQVGVVQTRSALDSTVSALASVGTSAFFSRTPEKIGATFARAYQKGQVALSGFFNKEVAVEDVFEPDVPEPVVVVEHTTATTSVATAQAPVVVQPVVQKPTSPQVVSNTYTTVINQSGVSEESLTSAIESTRNSLLSEIYKYSAAAERSSAGNFQAIALSQRISNLANITVSGVSGLTNADIPDDITVSGYLQSSGGTLSGITTFTHAPTLSHTFGAWSIGATGTNYEDAALIVNPASATADSNLLALAVNGSTKFLIDAEGDVFANSFTAVGGVTLATTTASTFSVENNTTLGDSITDTTTINGTLVVTGTTTASTIAGNFGVGTTSPWARLSVAGAASAVTPLFAISTSTASATSTAFLIDADGRVGVGTSTLESLLTVAGSFTTDGGDSFFVGDPASRSVVQTNLGAVGTNSPIFSNSSDDSARNNVVIAGYNNTNPRLRFYTTGTGAVGSHAQKLSGTNLFNIQGYGSDGSAYQHKGDIALTAIGDITSTSQTSLRFMTVGSSGSVTEKLTIYGDNIGVGTTTPFRKLSITDTVSAAQAAIAYDATRFAEFQVSSVGDLFFDTSGGDIFVNNDNFWVCDNSGCPALTATSTAGNLFVENAVTFGNGFSINQVSSTELGVYSSTGGLIITIDEGL